MQLETVMPEHKKVSRAHAIVSCAQAKRFSCHVIVSRAHAKVFIFFANVPLEAPY